MKKILAILIAALLLFSSVSLAQAAPWNNSVIDEENAEKGTIQVQYNGTENKKIKLMIARDGERYFYDIKNGKVEAFPLQMGSGSYSVRILKNIEGNRYRTVNAAFISVDNLNDKDVYLNSIQNIKWDPLAQPILKAQELTAGLENEKDKVKAVYSYLVNNFSYDYYKYNNLSSGYLPDINETYTSKKGICYDFSALFAAMLRSLDIPTKLVMGYSDNITEYHAWNEVYINGKWHTVDVTFDSQMKNRNMSVDMFKNPEKHEVVKTY